MKKKKFIFLLFIAIVVSLVIGLFCYNTPINFTELNPDDVLEIVVFNGNNGKTIYIEEKKDIHHIISNLNSVTLKRDKISIGYTGFSFRITIYLTNGEQADGWNNFIINSDDTVRKDPFFYKVVDNVIDYDYINNLFDEIN